MQARLRGWTKTPKSVPRCTPGAGLPRPLRRGQSRPGLGGGGRRRRRPRGVAGGAGRVGQGPAHAAGARRRRWASGRPGPRPSRPHSGRAGPPGSTILQPATPAATQRPPEIPRPRLQTRLDVADAQVQVAGVTPGGQVIQLTQFIHARQRQAAKSDVGGRCTRRRGCGAAPRHCTAGQRGGGPGADQAVQGGGDRPDLHVEAGAQQHRGGWARAGPRALGAADDAGAGVAGAAASRSPTGGQCAMGYLTTSAGEQAGLGWAPGGALARPWQPLVARSRAVWPEPGFCTASRACGPAHAALPSESSPPSPQLPQ